jgi:hypothetical protein
MVASHQFDPIMPLLSRAQRGISHWAVDSATDSAKREIPRCARDDKGSGCGIRRLRYGFGTMIAPSLVVT